MSPAIAPLLLALLSPSAQGTPAPAQALSARVLTMEDGLLHGTILDLVQGPQGFIWIATQDGLSRFDGREFIVVPLPGFDELITALAVDDGTHVWVGTRRGEVLRFDPQSMAVIADVLVEEWAEPPAEVMNGPRVYGLEVDDEGRLWIATAWGLLQHDPASGLVTQVTHAALDALLFRRGHLWTGQFDGTLTRWSVEGQNGHAVLANEGRWACGSRIHSVRQLNENTVWAGTETALCTVDVGGPGTPTFRFPGNYVSAIHQLPSGAIWLGTRAGLWELASPDDTAPAVIRNGLPHPTVLTFEETKDGVLWIGTWDGLVIRPPSGLAFNRISGDQGQAVVERLVAIESGGNQRLLLGSWGQGLMELDLTSGQVVPIDLTRATGGADGTHSIFGLTRGESGAHWVATLGAGVVRLGEDRTAVQWPIEETQVLSVFRDSRGAVWAGTARRGLFRAELSEGRFDQRYSFGTEDDVRSGRVWPILESPEGALWIGKFEGGLYRVSTDRTTLVGWLAGEGAGEGLTSDRILTLFQDADGLIWIGTQGGGMLRFDPETEEFAAFTVADGLPHNNVQGIAQDHMGLLWVSTNEGLARFDPATTEVCSFTAASGLAGNRFHANSVHTGSDGRLYFGGTDGLTIVDPERIRPSDAVPPVALTRFLIRNREEPVVRATAPDGIDLEPHENFFTFEFAALDFADALQNRYRYMLDPLDDEWIDIGTASVANYTSVPPGDYVFRVAARNSECVWNHQGLSIPIHVQAPFYRTLWFRSLVVGFLLSIALSFLAYRHKQLREREKFLLEIAGELHDEIGPNLSNIGLKADLVCRSQELRESERSHLADVGTLARDATAKVRGMVWGVNPRYDTLSALVEKMRDTAEEMLRGHFDADVVAPDDLPDQPVSIGLRNDLYRTFREALHNVVKHSGARSVEVTVGHDAPWLWFQVTDDGRGFVVEEAKNGNGLGLMNVRARKHKAQLDIRSQPGEGTTVELRARIK